MMGRLASAPLPGAPRILFVGLGHSSHTHGWIDLLRGAGLNARLFSMNEGAPPPDWPVQTYVTSFPPQRGALPGTRENLYLPGALGRTGHARGGGPGPGGTQTCAGAGWRASSGNGGPMWCTRWGCATPRISTCMCGSASAAAGLPPGWCRRAAGRTWPWTASTRSFPGASAKCWPAAIASSPTTPATTSWRGKWAWPPGKASSLGPVPGAGGVDVEALSAMGAAPPSARGRVIVWPKAYECRQSTARPVLEVLGRVFDEIRPDAVHMLAITPETRDWWNAQPPEVRARCHLHGRIPNAETLRLMAGARVMLAPSLSDGVPNSLYEAMALGALPIVSPLETITPLVRQEENVLFARNLYMDEIGAALTRAMADDALADAMAARNRELVARLADRRQIGARVREFYLEAAARRG